MTHLSPAASALPDTTAAFPATRKLQNPPSCKTRNTTLAAVLLPKPVSTLQDLITSTPQMSLPLFCLPTPLAITSVPCLGSSLKSAD